MTPILGIDIGRVIIDGDGADTDFLKVCDDDRAMQAPQMADAFDTIARLRHVFDGRVWVVSKCGANMQRKSTKWLHHHRFFDATGVSPDNLRFCLKRPEKAPICKDLGVTHFVDDRQDVLGFMVGIVTHRFLFNRNWLDTESAIMRTLAEDALGDIEKAAHERLAMSPVHGLVR